MRNSSDQNRDGYVQTLFQFQNDWLNRAKQESDQLGLTGISISYAEALTLQFLLQTWKSKKHIEIGTLTGFSAIVAALALGPEGQVWTFEKDEKHIEAARRVFEMKPLSKTQVANSTSQVERAQIHLCAGDAQVELDKISAHGPFDSIFIDGNKAAYGHYLAWAEENIKKGGLIIADNVFLGGSVYEQQEKPRFSPKQVDVLLQFNKRLSDPKFYRSCLVPTSEGLFVAEKLF